jgi:hypothetical protein
MIMVLLAGLAGERGHASSEPDPKLGVTRGL